MKPISSKNLIVPSLSLFTSLGTLLCCALPSLFVAIGAGAVLAGLISNMPFLIVLSKYKIILFIISIVKDKANCPDFFLALYFSRLFSYIL